MNPGLDREAGRTVVSHPASFRHTARVQS